MIQNRLFFHDRKAYEQTMEELKIISGPVVELVLNPVPILYRMTYIEL